MAIKPILFNTEMVRAILNGEKTVMRKPIKPKSRKASGFYVTYRKSDGAFMGVYDYDENEWMFNSPQKPLYEVGDLLWVKERYCIGTICCGEEPDGRDALYVEQQGDTPEYYIPYEYCIRNDIGIEGVKWKPCIHMPKEAASIWLRVTDVRVERLQDITLEQCVAEGIGFEKEQLDVMDEHWDIPFAAAWNSTIKKSDLDRYGWAANPWAWVIAFERCEKPEGE